MELMWAAFSVVWTLAAWLVAKSGWLMAKRWVEAGAIDNGVGFVLRRDDEPILFTLACNFSRFVALGGLLFVLIGIVVTIGWIVKAI